MNDAIRQAAGSDADWARSESRKQWVLRIVTAGALVALGVGVAALVLGLHNSTEITQIQHSACAVNPSSKECQTIKRESDQEQSVADACISFHKVGYVCPKPGSKAAHQEVHEQAELQHSKGVTPQTPSTAHQQPSPPSGGHTGGSKGTGDSEPHSPPASTPAQQPAAAPVATTPEAPVAAPAPADEPTSPEPSPTDQHPIRETVESVKAAACTVNALGVTVCIH